MLPPFVVNRTSFVRCNLVRVLFFVVGVFPSTIARHCVDQLLLKDQYEHKNYEAEGRTLLKCNSDPHKDGKKLKCTEN